jgi:hypothetical protein
VIPPMGVGAPAMEQHHGRMLRFAPVERSQEDAGTTRMGESFDSGFHRIRTLPIPGRGLNALR